jgi:hypothetical protein
LTPEQRDEFEASRPQPVAAPPVAAPKLVNVPVQALVAPQSAEERKRHYAESGAREGMEADLDEDPENYRTAYFLRVDTAVQCAVYSGPMLSEDMIAKAWSELALCLRNRLTMRPRSD